MSSCPPRDSPCGGNEKLSRHCHRTELPDMSSIHHLLCSCLKVPWIGLSADFSQEDSIAISNAAVTVFLVGRGGVWYPPLCQYVLWLFTCCWSVYSNNMGQGIWHWRTLIRTKLLKHYLIILLVWLCYVSTVSANVVQAFQANSWLIASVKSQFLTIKNLIISGN